MECPMGIAVKGGVLSENFNNRRKNRSNKATKSPYNKNFVGAFSSGQETKFFMLPLCCRLCRGKNPDRI